MEARPTGRADETDEQEPAERRRKRRRMLGQVLLDWSPVLARLTTIVMQHLS
ncbi:hypothetical protein ACIP4Y_35870 [Streptomyces sp. NPDC088810]|uniref:hypothetical protein n=1 Tax=Streptomyces sp. NPDC088810 TaxID=3365904 RepID=UPI00380C42D3